MLIIAYSDFIDNFNMTLGCLIEITEYLLFQSSIFFQCGLEERTMILCDD